jgi:hypothetical protein
MESKSLEFAILFPDEKYRHICCL